MPGSRRSAVTGRRTSTRSSVTSIAWIEHHARKRKRGNEDERPRTYKPGPASGARGSTRTERTGRSFSSGSCAIRRTKVWQALTDPAQLREWAPFDADRSLGTTGATVKLTTVGAPTPQVSETIVKRADPPKLLEYSWGDSDLRWELEPLGSGTRLTLWHNIDRRYISMGAAGWHICLDVLDHFLSGDPLGRIVGREAMKFDVAAAERGVRPAVRC